MNKNHAPIDNLDQCLDEFIGGENSLQLESDQDAWRPRVDVHKQAQLYRLEVELPGWNLDQVRITVEDNCLEIQCARTLPESEHDVIRRERHVGQFFRCFALPDDADSHKITTRAVNGVILIEIPRTR